MTRFEDLRGGTTFTWSGRRYEKLRNPASRSVCPECGLPHYNTIILSHWVPVYGHFCRDTEVTEEG